jgi:CheY-like chemotaxis protein
VFLPFEQVGDRAHRSEGTGLGLAIAHNLVSLMGGELRVESQLGKGSRFWFEIEVPVSTEAIALTTPADSQSITGYEGERRTILVIDDRWDNRAVIVNLLKPLGFELLEAVDGQEGLEMAIAHHPDVIISDLVMPVMDGFELIRHLRSCPEFDQTIILASSASVLEPNRQRSQAAGYQAFLAKPIQSEELLDLLQTHLQLVWICDNEQKNWVANNVAISDEETTMPSAEELVNLYEAAQIGHIERITQEANRLANLDPSYKAFSIKVLNLAEQFDDEAVVHLIEARMEKQ